MIVINKLQIDNRDACASDPTTCRCSLPSGAVSGLPRRLRVVAGFGINIGTACAGKADHADLASGSRALAVGHLMSMPGTSRFTWAEEALKRMDLAPAVMSADRLVRELKTRT